ncbi:LysE family translocator [Mesorhizobium sp. NBSH29]|uniref:LysE family translocator n=1 Tax=Mesorhizobium sp. NBSH29 TaxID=2654249 RepID=UPI0018968059|nr:LysE family translocator [Mesorhizobium sp. NBSH29]QPC86870.1 LysE family translocator [Mesorhizobium sp. NBSH29]
MDVSTALLFAATVLPLICTPGPDMLFVSAQALSGGATAGLRATAGICLGYLVHSGLAALGVAALIAASPLLFAGLRWLGVAYLAYLAMRLIGSALHPEAAAADTRRVADPLRRGFVTALLNPKGMMIYLALLPQFMDRRQGVAFQALVLSAIFVGLCALVYATLSLALGSAGRGSGYARSRRWIEGVAGGMLMAAAGRMALG